MPLVALDILPGLYLNKTRYSSQTRWVDGNLVRFRDGVAQQVGGWQVLQAPSAGITGAARALQTWRPNDLSARYMAIGTNTGAWLYNGTSLANITPPAPFAAGLIDTLARQGFGYGTFGTGIFGTPRPSGTNTAEAAQWTFDLWGELLLGTFGGVLYEFAPGTNATLIPVAGAPTCAAVVVSEERFVFALGANGDNTRVSWSDQENRNQWTPSALNKAGGYKLLTGSKLRCGRRGRGQVLVWTDTELFGFFPSSRQFVYGYERIANNCGVAGPKAVAAVGDTMFWMSNDNFWTFDGVVRPVDCDVYDYVFRDINLTQRAKFHAGINAGFEEVWFFYVSAAGVEIDRCVSYDYRRNVWSKHAMPRLAWEDKTIFPTPVATTLDGYVYSQETGVTAAGAVMPSFVESCPAEIGRGDTVQQIRSVWPDLQLGAGAVNITLKGSFSPVGAQDVFGPYRVDATTERLYTSAIARQLALRVDAASPGDYWEVGTIRVETGAGGMR